MVPIVPNEAGHLVRKETPDMESTGGILTFAWPPASEQPGSCLDPSPEIHQNLGWKYWNKDKHLRKEDRNRKGHPKQKKTDPCCQGCKACLLFRAPED